MKELKTEETVDVRGLPHSEREKIIFPRIDSLAEGKSMRLVVEFNPLPIVYMLEAREGFEVSYEKEGPEEWILRITRLAPQENDKELLKALLSRLKGGDIQEDIKNQARELFQRVDARTIGTLEQELIQEGISREEVRRSLCDIHLEVLRDSLVAKRIEVSTPHPVHTLMEEHKVILETLAVLGGLLRRLEGAGGFTELGERFLAELRDVAHHLVEAESHHQREEEALFPHLEKHGITEPAAIMKEDHAELRKRKQRLHQLALDPKSVTLGEFKENILELGGYLTRELESHIFKEDNILYQIALQVLDEEEWQEVKRRCDHIGYCCFTPGDRKHTQEKK